MTGYPVDRVHYEVAFLGRHVHWTLAELTALDHAQRLRWVDEVSEQVTAEHGAYETNGWNGRWA